MRFLQFLLRLDRIQPLASAEPHRENSLSRPQQLFSEHRRELGAIDDSPATIFLKLTPWECSGSMGSVALQRGSLGSCQWLGGGPGYSRASLARPEALSTCIAFSVIILLGPFRPQSTISTFDVNFILVDGIPLIFQ